MAPTTMATGAEVEVPSTRRVADDVDDDENVVATDVFDVDESTRIFFLDTSRESSVFSFTTSAR